MSERGLVELALRLWPQACEDSRVDDPADLDRLLDAIGQPGAPGYEGGLRNTFACFGPDEAAEVVLPSGERRRSLSTASSCASSWGSKSSASCSIRMR